MNKDTDFNSKKFLILVLLVCLAFFVMIIKAFEYLPSDEVEVKRINSQEINKPAEDSEEAAETNDESETAEAEKKTLNITLPQPNEAEGIELIEPPIGVNPDLTVPDNSIEAQNKNKAPELTAEQKTAQAIYIANKCRANGQYEKALIEYQKIPALTDDKSVIADSYEGIAIIYAVKHKYGTALSYASRAYNISPSSSRELLLARLFYKTGDIDKATKRINNVLHRDFSEDK